MKKHKIIVEWDNCPECGDEAEVMTDVNNKEGFVNDGDDVKCSSCEQTGTAFVDEDSDAYIMWDG